MVDFSKLNNSAAQAKATTLQETFLRLDRKVSHVELRPSQVALWTGQSSVDTQLPLCA